MPLIGLDLTEFRQKYSMEMIKNHSSAVLKKCGMVLEGVARQKYYKNGKYIDTALWAIIAGDRLY